MVPGDKLEDVQLLALVPEYSMYPIAFEPAVYDVPVTGAGCELVVVLTTKYPVGADVAAVNKPVIVDKVEEVKLADAANEVGAVQTNV